MNITIADLIVIILTSFTAGISVATILLEVTRR